MNTHKVVDGRDVDARLLELADTAVKRNSDGRISPEDAELLFRTLQDDGLYTDVERNTIEHIVNNFHWTPKAIEWFQQRLMEWEQAEARFISMSPEVVSVQQFSKQDVLREESDRISRATHLRTATMETYQDHDDISLIVRLADGRRVEVASNFIELEGDLVELRGGHVIPVRAIEKVEV